MEHYFLERSNSIRSLFEGGAQFIASMAVRARRDKKGGVPDIGMAFDERLERLINGEKADTYSAKKRGTYVFFAGVNASGKSTMIKAVKSFDEYSSYYYVCADEVEKRLWFIEDKTQRMLKAREIALAYREALLKDGENVIFESVASHPSHVDDLKRIKDRGNKIIVVYVGTNNPAINIERIKNRGRENDAFLNDERVIRRRQNSLKLLKDFIAISDEAVVFDNTTAYEPVFYKSADSQEFGDEKSWIYEYLRG